MEETARKKYEEIIGKSVFVPGLVIKPEKPWLGASPDGAFINDDGNLKLVEIKCPFSARESDIIFMASAAAECRCIQSVLFSLMKALLRAIVIKVKENPAEAARSIAVPEQRS